MAKELKPQEKKIVAEWFRNDFNAGNAYAKYRKVKDDTKCQAASRFFAKQEVKEYINELWKELESTEIASVQEILIYLTRVLRGQEKDAFDLDASLQDRTKAAETLGKAKGIFTQKIELDGSQRVTIVDDIDGNNTG